MVDEAPFSNRELQEMFNAADDRAEAFHEKLMARMDVFESNTSTDLSEIIKQTNKTNGSVADINKWRERTNGMFIASGIFMTMVVMPILAWAIFVLVNIQSVIHDSIDSALAAYDLTLK